MNHLRTRRSFLQELATGVIVAPWVTSGLRAQAPSSRIRHASFGCSGMAMADVSSISGHKSVDVVAGCDVDSKKAAEFQKSTQSVELMKQYRNYKEHSKQRGAH